MYVAFGSQTVSLMTSKKIKLPFTDIKTLIQATDYSILAVNGATPTFKLQVNVLF